LSYNQSTMKMLQSHRKLLYKELKLPMVEWVIQKRGIPKRVKVGRTMLIFE
jgi:hypothetical protein